MAAGNKTWTLTLHRYDYRSGEKEILVPEDCTVYTLIEVSCKAFNLKLNDIILTFQEFVLSAEDLEGCKKKLSDFRITDNSAIYLEIKRLPLQDLPGLITVTTDPEQPDMYTGDDDPQYPRAIMPCGHAIGSESMTTFCFSELKAGRTRFHCPYSEDYNSDLCGAEWPFNLVRHVGCFIRSELEEFESKLASLAMENAGGTQECPGGKNWVVRGSVLHNKSVCPVCSSHSKDGSTFEFCWQCLGPWKGKRDCGNAGCTTKDPRIEILASCSEKKIEEEMAPSIRGCPTCGMLIHHQDACKHMNCTRCSGSFCFFCLRPMLDGEWQCQAYGKDCKIQPRQTSLPNGISDGFEDLQDRGRADGMLDAYDSDRDSDWDWDFVNRSTSHDS